jgi:CRP-like cAMP-binding protein
VGDEIEKKADGRADSGASSRVQAGRRKAQSRAGLSEPLAYPLTLSEVPLFRTLNRRHLHKIALLATGRRFVDEAVVRQGDPADALYVIIDGTARVEAPGGHVEDLFPGAAFGELALLDGAPRAATVVAVGELLTARIDRKDFLRLIDEEPGMDLALINGVVDIIRDMQRGLVPTAPSLAGYYALDAARADASKVAGVSSPGWLSALNKMPLFGELSGRQLDRVVKLATLRRYGTGSVLVRTGSPGDSFHIILDGRAQVATPEGHERVLQPGDSFGELALIDNVPRAATVTAIDDVTTARLPRTAFLKLLRDEPKIAAAVLRGLVRTVRDIEGMGAAGSA